MKSDMDSQHIKQIKAEKLWPDIPSLINTHQHHASSLLPTPTPVWVQKELNEQVISQEMY